MKLITYDDGSGPKAGILTGEQIVDACAVLGQPVRDVKALL